MSYMYVEYFMNVVDYCMLNYFLTQTICGKSKVPFEVKL